MATLAKSPGPMGAPCLQSLQLCCSAHLEVPPLEKATLSPVKVVCAVGHWSDCCSFTAGCTGTLQARLPACNTSDLDKNLI